MAGLLKPTVAGLGYESKLVVTGGLLDGKALINGTSDGLKFIDSKSYFEFEVRHKVNIWRCGSTSKLYGALKLSKFNYTTSTFEDVTSTYCNTATAIDNTVWEKYIHDLPIGHYKIEYVSSQREDSEWYLEKIIPEKCVVLTESGEIKIFNSNNKWETLQMPALLDRAYVLSNGFEYDKLNSSIDNFVANTLEVDICETGEKIYMSDEIINNGNIVNMELLDNGESAPQVKITTTPFLPKDSLSSTDKIWYENPDETGVPIISNIEFFSTTTHSEDVGFKFNVLFNNSEKIKYRFRLNSGAFTNWSIPTENRNIASSIPVSMLSVGMNTLVLEVSNETDKVITETYTEIIELKNDAPIAIINNDSNSFRLHFIITDTNVGDKIEYRLLLSNNKVDELVLVPWTTPSLAPVEIDYAIDTTNVEMGKLNAITIEYRDNYNTQNKTVYTFTGEYKNIMFADENNLYYTTDKGAILKLLKFGNLQAGTISDAKPVRLVNRYGTPINNIVIDAKNLTVGKEEVIIELSKTKNPFIALPKLEYGDEVLNGDDFKVFYIRVKSPLTLSGGVNFEVHADATV